jgi:hypothetical protein
MNKLTTLVAAAAVAVALSPNPASAFFGDYTMTTPTVRCTSHVDVAGNVVLRTIVPMTPGMFAPSEPAKVSWQPMLNRWNGQAWVRDVTGPVLVGLASMSTSLPASSGFVINMTRGHYYRVSIVFRWYSGDTVIRSTHQWAGQHVYEWKQYGYLGMANEFDAGPYCQL